MFTLISNSTQDGWVLEASENSNTGGSSNNSGTTFWLGDNAANRQYRAILSFGTGALPDNAILVSVTLKIRSAGQTGSNPFGTLGNIAVDIRRGRFNNNVALENADFQATADKNGAMTITNSPAKGWYSKGLSASNFSLINKTGVTQFRLRFGRDDNNNHAADALKFYSGNFTTTPSYRPTLIIQYRLP
jgi:hypothetical protein